MTDWLAYLIRACLFFSYSLANYLVEDENPETSVQAQTLSQASAMSEAFVAWSGLTTVE